MDGIRKKVLYISYDGMTDPLGQSQVIPYLIALIKDGYQFTLLSVEKKNRFKESGAIIGQLLKNAGIKWETLTYTGRPPVISKLYDQWQLNRKVAKLHKQENFDMMHCRSYVAAEAAMRLSLRTGVPFLFDMRGFWVDERVDSGLWNLKNPLYKYFYKIYKQKEKKYFSCSRHIISLTEKGKEELIKNYKVPDEKISVIPCCADLNHFDYRKFSVFNKQSVKSKLGISENTKVLSYLGSLGGWYMTEEMLDFFAILQKEISDAVFLFITHDDEESIISKAILKGIDRKAIKVQPASRHEVPMYLSISDWSIFFIKNMYSKRASSPTKQGEIMAMGIPIICNDIGDTGKIINDTHSGVVMTDFNEQGYEEIVNSLKGLLLISKEHIRESAHKYYDLQSGVATYNKVYKKISGKV
jgi:glycosyltransferase involved in cell wall biosynthesis